MRLRPKHFGYAFTILGFLLSFFFNFTLPKDWATTLNFVATVESWWTAHAAHPLLAAFFIGVSFGAVVIPEVWPLAKDHLFPSDPRPDWDLREAFQYMRLRSKWAMGRPYFVEDEDRLLEEDIDEVMRDAAAQGRISIWGRPAQTGAAALFSRGIEIKIPVDDLQDMSIDLTTIDGTAPNGMVFRQHSEDQYRFLRVNRREVYREWPAASYARLFFDKTWKSRRLQIVPNVAEAT